MSLTWREQRAYDEARDALDSLIKDCEELAELAEEDESPDWDRWKAQILKVINASQEAGVVVK